MTRPNFSSLPLPAVRDPHRYEGLYVFDFGTHVSIGYTAREIEILLRSDAYKDGTAYHIYRCDERGAFELRGVTDAGLTMRDAVCFLRRKMEDARDDFEHVQMLVRSHPPACAVELVHGKIDALDPPYVTAIVFANNCSTLVSGWLSRHLPNTGDSVEGGSDICHIVSTAKDNVERLFLGSSLQAADRTEEEVLRCVHESVQR